MTLVLVAALVAPGAGALVAAAFPERATLAVRVAPVVAGGAWLLLLVDGSSPSAGGFHSGSLVAAAALGACLIAAAVDVALLERPPFLGAALAAVLLGLAGGRAATQGPFLLAGAGGAVAAVAWATRPPAGAWVARTRPRRLLLGVGGVAVGTAGVVAARAATDSWALPPTASTPHRAAGFLLLLGAVLLVLCGSERARAPAALLVPAGLFLGVASAPLVRGAGGWTPAALVVGGTACASAVAARAGRPLMDRPTAALGLLSIAAAVGPGAARPAALLLASAATLTSAAGIPVAAVAGIPGGVALAVALTGKGGPAALVEGVLAGGVALALAAATGRGGTPGRPPRWTWPALAFGAWLVVAPGSWAWAGPAGLRAYDLGAAGAVAGAGLCLASVELRRRVPARWYARPSSQAPEDAVHH